MQIRAPGRSTAALVVTGGDIYMTKMAFRTCTTRVKRIEGKQFLRQGLPMGLSA